MATGDKLVTLDELKTAIENKSSVEYGMWIPHIYDNQTKVAELPEQKYWKIGPIYIIYVYNKLSTDISISSMLQIRNLPCTVVIGGTLYSADDTNNFGDRTIQPTTGAVYIRPNYKGTMTTNAIFSALIIGF